MLPHPHGLGYISRKDVENVITFEWKIRNGNILSLEYTVQYTDKFHKINMNINVYFIQSKDD